MSTLTITAKIQKLLALSTSPNEYEATAAATKAHELLAQHNLTLADLPTTTDTDPLGEIGHMTDSSKIGAPWIRAVWTATARLYFCDYMYGRGNHKTFHWVIGAQHNTQVAASMAHYLATTVVNLSNQATPPPGEKPSSFKSSFRAGCARRICTRLHEKRRLAQAPSATNPSNLPALYTETRQALDAYMEETFGGIKTTKPKNQQVNSHAGYSAGTEAGNTVGLDSQVSTPSTKALLNG